MVEKVTFFNQKKILAKVNIVFILNEVRPEMELFLDNHLRCVKSLNAISKYIPNARLTIFFVFMTNPSKNPSNYKNLIKSNRLLTLMDPALHANLKVS